MSLKNLKIIMRMKGYTAETLAAKSKVPKSTIDKILSGNTPDPRYNTVKDLVNALNLNVDELIYYLDLNTDDIGKDVTSKNIVFIEKHMHDLNEEGQQRLITYAEDLVASGKYKPAAPELKIKTSVYDKDHIALTLVAEPSTPGMADSNHHYQTNAAHSRNDIEIEESVDTSEDHIMDDEEF